MKTLFFTAIFSTLLSFGPVAPAAAQSLYGTDCTFECSGHDAGYDWAQKQALSGAYACAGKSKSFVDGCQAYTKENGGDLLGDDFNFGFGITDDGDDSGSSSGF